jgi:hypothetical protein
MVRLVIINCKAGGLLPAKICPAPEYFTLKIDYWIGILVGGEGGRFEEDKWPISSFAGAPALFRKDAHHDYNTITELMFYY